jgi:hypothetical protein
LSLTTRPNKLDHLSLETLSSQALEFASKVQMLWLIWPRRQWRRKKVYNIDSPLLWADMYIWLLSRLCLCHLGYVQVMIKMSRASDMIVHRMILLHQIIELNCTSERYSRWIKRISITLEHPRLIAILFIHLECLSNIHFKFITWFRIIILCTLVSNAPDILILNLKSQEPNSWHLILFVTYEPAQ